MEFELHRATSDHTWVCAWRAKEDAGGLSQQLASPSLSAAVSNIERNGAWRRSLGWLQQQPVQCAELRQWSRAKSLVAPFNAHLNVPRGIVGRPRRRSHVGAGRLDSIPVCKRTSKTVCRTGDILSSVRNNHIRTIRTGPAIRKVSA